MAVAGWRQSFDRFVYTSNIKNDTHLQDFANTLTEQHCIEVIVWSIDDINLAIETSDTLRKTYTVSNTGAANPTPQKFNTPPVNPTVFIGRENELTAIHAALCRLSNFHILVTSRVSKFADAKRHKVAQLNESDAKELFCRDYFGHNPGMMVI